MSYGLQVWDQSGNLTVNTTDRIAKTYSTIYWTYTGATNYFNPTNPNITVTVSVPGITPYNDTWWCYVSSTGFWRVRTINVDSVTLDGTADVSFLDTGHIGTNAPTSGYLIVIRI